MESEIKLPEHIAIIMDGNRRWAKENNKDRFIGHKIGAKKLQETAKYCNRIGLKYLTVYAFSTENWKRTEEEVKSLMFLLNVYLKKYLGDIDMEGIKVRILGDKNGLNPKIKERLIAIEEKTKNNKGMTLNIAFNYGGRAEIVRAVKLISQDVLDGKIGLDDITEDLVSDNLYTRGEPDPDLVIRTSGELRTSNFLPWQITYSEFLWLDKYWPDFTSKDIDDAIVEFNNRKRRKGK